MLIFEEGVIVVAVETEEASLPWLVPVTTDAWPLILTLPPPPPPPRRPLGAAQTAKQSLAALQCNYIHDGFAFKSGEKFKDTKYYKLIFF